MRVCVCVCDTDRSPGPTEMLAHLLGMSLKLVGE